MLNLESDLDASLHCVDPHLVQPLADFQQPTFDDILAEEDSETKSSFILGDSPQSQQNCDQLEMERYMNLQLFVTHLDDTTTNCFTDELHTPELIEAKELSKVTNIIKTDGNPFNFANNKTHDVNAESALQPKTINNNSKDGAGMIIDDKSNSIISDSNAILSPNNFDIDDINMDEYDFLPDFDEAIFNDIKNYNSVEQQHISNVIDNSNQSSNNVNAINEYHNYALKLNIDKAVALFGEADVLQTPDVINTICSFELEDNVYFRNNEAQEQAVVKVEEIKEEDREIATPSPPSPIQDARELVAECFDDESSSLASLVTPASLIVKQRGGRRKKRDSDDEDYIPPGSTTTSKSLKRQRACTKLVVDIEEEYTPAKVSKRGRPSKPASRASDSSECSKYREMRDKNNEASRRSRRKRREQEINVEQEMDELLKHNERLKIQVAELERSVTTYRNNLMTILLSRK